MDSHPPSLRWRTFLPVMDVLGIAVAYSVAYYVRLGEFEPNLLLSKFVIAFGVMNLFSLYLFNLYEFNSHEPSIRKPIQSVIAVFIASCVIVLFAYLSGAVEFRGIFGRGVLIGAQVLFAIWAASFRGWISRWFKHASARSRYLVLGSSENLPSFVKDLKNSRMSGTFYFLTPEKCSLPPYREGSLGLEAAGSWVDFDKLVTEDWTAIVVCAGNSLSEEIVESLMDTRLRGVRVVDLTDFYEQNWFKVPVFYLQRSWFAMAQGFQLLHNPVGLRLKRIFDVLGAGLLLVMTSPLIALAAIIVKLESKGPVIFSQTRVGENGRLFTVYKIRSMRADAEKDGAQWAQVGDSRVTRWGNIMRMTRIDELPQLFNVIRGDMSFIGPRPERPEFTGDLEAQIPFYNLRHILRPGVTGWAQVMYPYGASVEDAHQKLQYELYYIKNYSLLLDAAIVLKTVRVVLFGRGR